MNKGDEEDDIGLTASFMAKNLVLTKRVDADGEREKPLLVAGKIDNLPDGGSESTRSVWRHLEMQVALVCESKPGILLFFFGEREDKARVLGGRPWTLKGAQLILQDWPAQLTIDEIQFDKSSFWVRLCALPPGYVNLVSAKEVTSMFVRFLGYSAGYDNVLRLKVEVDISKGLHACFFF